MTQPLSLTIKPLRLGRWGDFEKLFGRRGACAGCWCMFWKLPNKDFQKLACEGNKAAQKAITESGRLPGLLAYDGHETVGWVAIETCFFTRRDYRGQGVSVALLKACIEHVRKRRGKILEGYPTEPKSGKLPAPFVYTGLASAFRETGFNVVARRSPTRPIFRHVIGGNR